jgi:tetratricopeptide (TPR) repeat protein
MQTRIDKVIFYKVTTPLQLADLATQIGDYKCALDNYKKAFNFLDKIEDERAIAKANELKGMIQELTPKKEESKAILMFDTWKLSKTSFVKGNQCVKHLYLDKHKRNEKAPISDDLQALFDQGHAFEDKLRKQDFPGGINVKEVVGNFAYFNSYTKYLLDFSSTQTIYEATIIEDEVFVMCDVLVKAENGMIDIYEIKLNREINDAILDDLAIQYHVCKKRFGKQLNSFNLILRADEKGETWKIENFKDHLDLKISEIKATIEHYKQILLGAEPTVEMGGHCMQPYKCDFLNYCKKNC